MGDPGPTPPMSHSGLCGRGLHIAFGCGRLHIRALQCEAKRRERWSRHAAPWASLGVLLSSPLQPAEERSLLRTPTHSLPVSRDSLPVQSTLTPSTLTPSTLTPSIPCLEHSLLAGTRPTPHITGQLPYHTQAPAAAVPSPPPLPSLPVPTQSLEPLHLFILSLSPDSLSNQRFLPA